MSLFCGKLTKTQNDRASVLGSLNGRQTDTERRKAKRRTHARNSARSLGILWS